jgi:Rod binding domain-containing protein
MGMSPIVSNLTASAWTPPTSPKPPDPDAKSQALRRNFEDFVGQTLFGEMLKSMRKTQHKPAYFHGGRAEEIFQQQLDQVLAEKLSHASAEKLAGPMYELFTMNRRQ